jgi:hypothetical protein
MQQGVAEPPASYATEATLDSASSKASEQVQVKPHVASHDCLTPTLFHQEWWLDAATGGSFQVAEVTANGKTVGRIPFFIRKRFGFRELRMPPLTYFLGPAIDAGEGSPNNRFLKCLDVTRELLNKLPQTSSQYVKCHAGITDVIAFQEACFRTHVQFTHELEPDPVDTLWQQMRNKTRNVIRRAEEQLTVAECTDVPRFLRMYDENLSEKGLHNDIESSSCRRLLSAALERNQGRIVAAFDNSSEMVAANFCAWDETSSFYIMSTRSQDSGNGVTSLLIWEAIKHAAAKRLIFDFAGLGSRGSIHFYTGFGATVKPRYVAVRARPLKRMLSELKSVFGGENFFY